MCSVCWFLPQRTTKARADPREGQGWPTWRSGLAHVEVRGGPCEGRGWPTWSWGLAHAEVRSLNLQLDLSHSWQCPQTLELPGITLPYPLRYISRELNGKELPGLEEHAWDVPGGGLSSHITSRSTCVDVVCVSIRSFQHHWVNNCT